MIRTAFLVGASVIAVACVACAPKTPAPQAAPPPEQHAQRCTDEASFIKSVHILKPGYDPTTYENPPASDAALPPVVEEDLGNAFKIAPDFFKKYVCALDGVFLDPTYCDNASQDPARTCVEFSWGFRSHNESNKGKRYVAISLNLWSADNSPRTAGSRYGPHMTDGRRAPKFTDYSTRQLNTLLTQLNHLHWNVPPRFDSGLDRNDPADTPAMTVLAVLAHEVGHVRWYDLTKPKPGITESYDFARLTNCTPGGSFFEDSWNSLAPPNEAFAAPHWLNFGQLADPGLVVHATGPRISDFVRPGQQAIERSQPEAYAYRPQRGGDRQAAALTALAGSLSELYGNASPWASLLGSLSPTEDLVETYTLSVLTDKSASTPLRSLRLIITAPDRKAVQQDVVADLPNKPALARKLACLSTLNHQTYR